MFAVVTYCDHMLSFRSLKVNDQKESKEMDTEDSREVERLISKGVVDKKVRTFVVSFGCLLLVLPCTLCVWSK